MQGALSEIASDYIFSDRGAKRLSLSVKFFCVL